jgi:hypothetical protein
MSNTNGQVTMPEDGQISTIGTREVDGTSFTARAMLLGERFDTRALESDAKILAIRRSCWESAEAGRRCYFVMAW